MDNTVLKMVQIHPLKQTHFSIGSSAASGKSIYRWPVEKNSEKFAVIHPPGWFTIPISRERREKSRDDPQTTEERCRAAGSS